MQSKSFWEEERQTVKRYKLQKIAILSPKDSLDDSIEHKVETIKDLCVKKPYKIGLFTDTHTFIWFQLNISAVGIPEHRLLSCERRT